MTSDPTLSTGEIARLGGVGRAAVSNWRRRHEDFPEPVAGTAASPRFALSDIEAWLRRNGRTYRMPPADLAWQRLRPAGDDLHLTARVAAAGRHLLGVADPDAVRRLPGTPADTPPVDAGLRRVLDQLAATVGPATAFEDLCSRLRAVHRSRPDAADDTAATMAAIALPGPGTLLDPACGTGGLLLAAAPRPVTGATADPEQARIAATRLLLSGADGRIAVTDVLRAELPDRTFDGVVCDPPAERRSPEHAGDPRFGYGTPPRTEPELAWVQLGLAAVVPGGTVVVRMPPAAADRRAGRRIRTNLLRAGALRAVLAVEDGDLWVLRRPRPGATNPAPVLLVGRGDAEEVHAQWTAHRTGRDLPAGARTVPVVELLDDTVDIGPERLLPRLHEPDPGTAWTELYDRDPAAADVPPLVPLLRRRELATATLSELTRAGMVRARQAGTGIEVGDGETVVLTVTDLAVGTVATGRTSDTGSLVRVRPGDVVASAMGRVRVAESRAVLGPGLVAYRVDPERLDAQFLAGVLRCAPTAPGSGSTRHGQRTRVPLLPLDEQRRIGDAFRRLLAAADAARAAADRAEELHRIGTTGLVEGWLAPDQRR